VKKENVSLLNTQERALIHKFSELTKNDFALPMLDEMAKGFQQVHNRFNDLDRVDRIFEEHFITGNSNMEQIFNKVDLVSQLSRKYLQNIYEVVDKLDQKIFSEGSPFISALDSFKKFLNENKKLSVSTSFSKLSPMTKEIKFRDEPNIEIEEPNSERNKVFMTALKHMHEQLLESIREILSEKFEIFEKELTTLSNILEENQKIACEEKEQLENVQRVQSNNIENIIHKQSEQEKYLDLRFNKLEQMIIDMNTNNQREKHSLVEEFHQLRESTRAGPKVESLVNNFERLRLSGRSVQRDSRAPPRMVPPHMQDSTGGEASHIRDRSRVPHHEQSFVTERPQRRESSIVELQTTEALQAAALRKEVLRNFPNVKDWPEFTGEGEYNHQEFIDWVDQLRTTMNPPDVLITSKLSLVFKGTARQWLLDVMKEDAPYTKTWEEWKEAIQSRFGNSQWKNNMERSFMADYYKPETAQDCVKWAN
jgi:hypothetical protein